MGLHVIIGKGNLGLDLQEALAKAGHDARLLTASEDFKWPDSLPQLLDLNPECVWCVTGKGSVAQAASPEMMGEVLLTHFCLPVGLATSLPPHIKLAVFSTDYAADEADAKSPFKTTPQPRSIYAAMKIAMEQAIKVTKRGQTTIFRVGSLYGGHFPERTFPGKVAVNHQLPCEVRLPQNWVVPTPTWWIANMLVANIKSAFDTAGVQIKHIAPNGGAPLLQWGRLVLGNDYTYKSNGFDASRPSFSGLGLSFNSQQGVPDWKVLWEEHLQRYSSFPGVRK